MEVWKEVVMSFTGVDSLDRSIDKTNVWLADIAQGFGTGDRRLAYRAARPAGIQARSPSDTAAASM
jgi:hypothetical protein